MNENLDLTKILKDCPKGTKLYSPLFGEVTFYRVIECLDDYPVGVLGNKHEDDYICFTKDGRYFKYPEAECMLFPSKDNRDWSTFKVPNKLPKTWEEFCVFNYNTTNNYYIDYTDSLVINNGIFSNNRHIRDSYKDKCLLPNKETAEAMLALCQLIQLRDCYNNGWQPDFSDDTIKYIIDCRVGEISASFTAHFSRPLIFKTRELCKEFFNNFKDLIEIAKPLL